MVSICTSFHKRRSRSHAVRSIRQQSFRTQRQFSFFPYQPDQSFLLYFIMLLRYVPKFHCLALTGSLRLQKKEKVSVLVRASARTSTLTFSFRGGEDRNRLLQGL